MDGCGVRHIGESPAGNAFEAQTGVGGGAVCEAMHCGVESQRPPGIEEGSEAERADFIRVFIPDARSVHTWENDYRRV